MRTKIIVVLIICAIILGGFLISKHVKTNNNQSGQQQETLTEKGINGSRVSPETASSRPIAVVIENHTDSRPQSGLSEADIVYETLTEGGITRFLAIFQSKQPKEIGPIRSARPYFNFLADMWHAPLVHSGGSKQALSELSSKVYKNLFDVNEFYYGDSFTRNKDRQAPHNLYSTIKDLNKLLEKKGQTNWQKVSLWETNETDNEPAPNPTTAITIPFSIGSYTVNYKYNTEKKTYERFVKNSAQIDKNTNAVIAPKNVIIMLAEISPIPDDELGTQNIKLNNNGQCFYASNGVFESCQWNFNQGLHNYTDKDGKALVLLPGQTFIEIFPRDRQNEVVTQ